VQRRERLGDALAYLLLIIGSLAMVGPFVWMLSTSLKEPADQFTRTLIPNPVTLENYRNLWAALPITKLILNSLKVASLAMIGQLLTCSMAAFVFATIKFRGRQFLFIMLLVTLMIPFQVTLIPNFILYKYLGLYGTQLPLYVPYFLGGAFGTFLLRQYFLTIPLELAEAARIDGASLFQIYWRIYLPLARPALAALAIFTFLFSWNDLFGPLIYLPSDLDKTTLPVGLALLQSQYGGKWTIMMAGVLVSIAPIITVFFFAQKQFIEGIALSGVK
jgi:multiple sugar transport system permease protein